MEGGCTGALPFDSRTSDRLRISTTSAAEGKDDFWLLIPLAEKHVPGSVGAGKTFSFEQGLCFRFAANGYNLGKSVTTNFLSSF